MPPALLLPLIQLDQRARRVLLGAGFPSALPGAAMLPAGLCPMCRCCCPAPDGDAPSLLLCCKLWWLLWVWGLLYLRLPLLPHPLAELMLETATEPPSDVPSSVLTAGHAMPPALLLQQEGVSSANWLLLQPSEPLKRLGFGGGTATVRIRGGKAPAQEV